MGPEDSFRNGKGKARELCGPDGARRSIAMTLGLSPSEYDETQVSARKTCVTSLNIQGTGANLGHRTPLFWILHGATALALAEIVAQEIVIFGYSGVPGTYPTFGQELFLVSRGHPWSLGSARLRFLLAKSAFRLLVPVLAGTESLHLLHDNRFWSSHRVAQQNHTSIFLLYGPFRFFGLNRSVSCNSVESIQREFKIFLRTVEPVLGRVFCICHEKT